jgi:2-isopropylmalate synthase
MTEITVFDTTLRDGQQGPDVEFSASDMLEIAKILDGMGVHFIEGGWPGANPRFDEFFARAKKVKFKQAQLAAFGKTREKFTKVEEDKCLQALLAAETPAVVIFGKTWKLHVEIMENTFAENLKMIYESVEFLKQHDRTVVYDAEHFFDAYKDDAEYALKTLEMAVSAGADWVTLCDTNGGTMPYEVEEIMIVVKEKLGCDVKLGIHAHNDCGLAVANSLSAVRLGAKMVQGTVNGFGERAGNADLTTVIPNLQFKMGKSCLSERNMSRLRWLSDVVSEMANITAYKGRPFVGSNSFAHKGGVHVSAVMKNPLAYEHMAPELVGNERRILVSDLAGKGNIETKMEQLGIEGDGDSYKEIVQEIKKREAEGYKFENADDSLALLIKRHNGTFDPLFKVISFHIATSKEGDQECRSIATVKVANVEGEEEITAAEGFGPVGALDNALRKALKKFFPADLGKLHLADFKVRVINGSEGTGAKVRASVESIFDQNQVIRTVGVSHDVVAASFEGLIDSFHTVLGNGK